jgi:two-component system, LytTR family, sensor kinase
LFLAAPRVARTLDRFIDRAWLHRRYSIDEAERRFAEDIQNAASVEDLRRDAAASAASIFQSSAVVDFENAAAGENQALTVDLHQDGSAAGRICVAAREDGVPFLSDDHRLLRVMARVLSSRLDSLRLRDQRKQHEEREQQLRLLATRAELKALRAQINPHFLFNALNTIAALIHGDPGRADQTIECLAQVFRYALRKPEREWVTVAEELAFVDAYLGVERARFGSRLIVEFQTDASASSFPIPAVTIQPIIENAIKHGVSSIEGDWIVSIRTVLSSRTLSIEVLDNGPGFPPDYSIGASGHALRNVADRLAGYYGGAARLICSSANGQTRVRLEIPAREKDLHACAS